MIVLPISIFIIGLIVGSFLNVVILRIHTGRSVVHGRSACARCSRTLAWYELVPVVSFLALKGKCRTCSQGISFQYPVVELVTAIVFTILYSKMLVGVWFVPLAWLTFGFALVIASLLIVITVYDVRHKIIPDSVVYPFILLAFLSVLFRGVVSPEFSVVQGFLGGALTAVPFFLLWYFSKGKAMGFGDVKLMLGIGWLTGLALGVSVLVVSFWIGGVAGLFLIALTKKYHMKSEVAFGPFLIIAFFLVQVLGVTMYSFIPVWR